MRQTWNRYRKIVPGAAKEAGAKMDAYLDKTVPQPLKEESPLYERAS